MTIQIEYGGNIFRGLAVPFGESSLAVDSSGNVFEESFDEHSIDEVPANIPLLVGHRRDMAPVGRVVTSGLSKLGLAVEGEFVGSDDEVEGIRRKIGAGLLSGLSIGFVSRGRQLHRRPLRRGDPPSVTRRGVAIVEISLVPWAAYKGATVASVNVRTASVDASRQLLEEMTASVAAARQYLGTRQRR